MDFARVSQFLEVISLPRGLLAAGGVLPNWMASMSSEDSVIPGTTGDQSGERVGAERVKEQVALAR